MQFEPFLTRIDCTGFYPFWDGLILERFCTVWSIFIQFDQVLSSLNRFGLVLSSMNRFDLIAYSLLQLQQDYSCSSFIQFKPLVSSSNQFSSVYTRLKCFELAISSLNRFFPFLTGFVKFETSLNWYGPAYTSPNRCY